MALIRHALETNIPDFPKIKYSKIPKFDKLIYPPALRITVICYVNENNKCGSRTILHWIRGEKLQWVTHLGSKSETNNDFIWPGVLQSGEGKPPMTNSLEKQDLCSTKGNFLLDLFCKASPRTLSGPQEAQNNDDFHSLRQTGRTWATRKKLCSNCPTSLYVVSIKDDYTSSFDSTLPVKLPQLLTLRSYVT